MELFRDVIMLASERLGISEVIVEKDYYATLILKKLATTDYPIVFKGGTSLSKAYRIIDRFSEDIDITFAEHLGEAKRKKLKYNIIKPIADELGLMIQNLSSVESDKNLNHYDFCYTSVVGSSMHETIAPYVRIETSLMSYAFPTEERNIGNYLLDALGDEEIELIRKYDLGIFPMKVQSLARTLADKIFAVCDYYMLDKPHRNARHLYDIHKLASYVEIDNDFIELVENVRNHRIDMGADIAPCAPMDVDILSLVYKICDEDFYKEDYERTTVRLISDAVTYDDIKKVYKKLARKIFNHTR